MEIAELILKYIQVLAWPSVAVILAWTLRSHVRAAVARMTRLETPVGSVEFAAHETAAIHAADEVRAQDPEVAEQAAGSGQWVEEAFERLRILARESPRLGIQGAWSMLAGELYEVADRLAAQEFNQANGLDYFRTSTGGLRGMVRVRRVLQYLAERGLSSAGLELVESLLSMHRLVSPLSFEPGPGTALRYVDNCALATRELRSSSLTTSVELRRRAEEAERDANRVNVIVARMRRGERGSEG
ncbi:hypothetical protein [Streptomyces sp. NPDC057729]|uniref:hypothetical protein n=1 Tax=Streptomyces sp. NPDC057729 TaxID=3346230 RepID=UPI00368334D9